MANKQATRTTKIPAGYEPISMWGYFGYGILFSIPIIGWIFVIVFAISAENHNLKNFARSQFCLWIIWIALVLIASLSGLATNLLQNMM